MTHQRPPVFPVLQRQQCAVLHVEAATGKFLTPAGQRATAADEAWYEVFESEELAHSYALEKSNSDPSVHCTVFDDQGRFVKLYYYADEEPGRRA